MSETALIVGAGSGLSGSLARLLRKEGFRVALAARNVQKLDGFDAQKIRCDATDRAQVEAAFDALPAVPDLVVYNASYRTRGPVAELDLDEVRKSLEVTAYAGFLVGRAATSSGTSVVWVKTKPFSVCSISGSVWLEANRICFASPVTGICS